MADRGPLYAYGRLEIDLGRREFRIGGAPVPIGERAFQIVEIRVRSAGELVSKDELMRRVWRGAVVEDNTLEVHISVIRKALGPDRGLLKTAYGRGYRLLGAWTMQQVAMPAPPREATTEPGGNLPLATTALIGRKAAIEQLCRLVSKHRLVTLTGLGGIGKTRLALEVAQKN